MGYHGVEHFSIPITPLWNKRQGLGDGTSYIVEEASLPLSGIMGSINHHKPHGRLNLNQDWYFTDHAGRRWNRQTRAAFKVPGSQESSPESKESNDIDLLNIIQELRILCHPPLNNHPNIVSLLGIAWIIQPKQGDTRSDEDSSQRDRPTVVIESAPLGSLHDFVQTRSYREQHVSLKTKLSLCIDILRAMLVSSLPVSGSERT